MSRINLLPPELRKERANARLARMIAVAGMALFVLLAGVYAIRTWQILTLRGELEGALAEKATVESQIGTFADLVAQQQAVAYAKGITASLLSGEISWSDQMLQVASAVPLGVTLTSVSGASTPQADGQLVGSITWSATSTGYVSAEAWLVRLDAQEGWANGWTDSVQGGEGSITANGSVDLTSAAITPRGGGPA